MAFETHHVAIYKNGQLTLEEPLELPEGAKVEIVVRWEEPINEVIDKAEAVIAQETALFIAQHSQLLLQYRGEYIAMHKGKVVDHDRDRVALHQRVDETWGDTPILVTPVKEKPVQEFVFRSPRLERH